MVFHHLHPCCDDHPKPGRTPLPPFASPPCGASRQVGDDRMSATKGLGIFLGPAGKLKDVFSAHNENMLRVCCDRLY